MKYLILFLLPISCFGQFGTTRDLAFWGKKDAGFQLADIGDLLLWCDVSTATNSAGYGPPTNGMNINDLSRDLSPQNHTVQCTDGTTYVSTGGGGNGNYPYLIMTNANGGIGSGVGTPDTLTNGTQFTVVSVIKPVGLGDGNGYLWGDTTSADGAGANGAFRLNGSGGHNQVNDNSVEGSNGGAVLESDDASTPWTNWVVLTICYGAASSSIWSNNIQIKTGTIGTTWALNRDAFEWGRIIYTGANYGEIHFERGLVYGHSLTSNECYQVNRKCMDDFGFP